MNIQQKLRRNLAPLSLFFLVSLISLLYLATPVYATNDTINVTEFPDLVGDAFNVDSTTAGLILSTCVLLSLGLALAYLKAKGLILITVELVAMSALIILGWMPYFIMLVIVLLLAILYADKVRRAF